MTALMEPRSGLKYGWQLGESGWNVGMDDNLKTLGRFGFHLSVKDKDLAAPPGSPAAGDMYIIATGATGAWAGKDGQIAFYDGSSWVFQAPRIGWRAFVEDEEKTYILKAAGWAISDGALNTTYSVFGASGSSHSIGLVPDPGATAGASRFLCEDGTWSSPSATGGTGNGTGPYPLRPPSPTVFTTAFDGRSATPTVFYDAQAGYVFDRKNYPFADSTSFRGKAVNEGSYTAVARFKLISRGGQYVRYGIGLTNGTSFIAIVLLISGTGTGSTQCSIGVQKYTLTAFTSGQPVLENIYTSTTADAFMRIRSDGTNIYFDYSQNGSYWINVYTEAKNASFVASHIGFVIQSYSGSGSGSSDGGAIVCSHWSDTDYPV